MAVAIQGALIFKHVCILTGLNDLLHLGLQWREFAQLEALSNIKGAVIVWIWLIAMTPFPVLERASLGFLVCETHTDVVGPSRKLEFTWPRLSINLSLVICGSLIALEVEECLPNFMPGA